MKSNPAPATAAGTATGRSNEAPEPANGLASSSLSGEPGTHFTARTVEVRGAPKSTARPKPSTAEVVGALATPRHTPIDPDLKTGHYHNCIPTRSAIAAAPGTMDESTGAMAQHLVESSEAHDLFTGVYDNVDPASGEQQALPSSAGGSKPSSARPPTAAKRGGISAEKRVNFLAHQRLAAIADAMAQFERVQGALLEDAGSVGRLQRRVFEQLVDDFLRLNLFQVLDPAAPNKEKTYAKLRGCCNTAHHLLAKLVQHPSRQANATTHGARLALYQRLTVRMEQIEEAIASTTC